MAFWRTPRRFDFIFLYWYQSVTVTLFMMRQMGNGVGSWVCLKRYGFPSGYGFPDPHAHD